MTPVYLAVLLPATALALWWVAARPRAGVVLAALALQQALGALAAALLGEDFFGILRLLCWGVFGLGPALLLGSALLLRRRARRAAWVALAAGLGLALVALDAFLIEPRSLAITRLEVRSPKVERALRVVALADLQHDGLGRHEKQALAAALAERPDLLLLLGDYIQEDSSTRRARLQRDTAAYLREIGFAAPLGAYAVRGNVDNPDWAAAFAGTGVVAIEKTTRLDAGPLTLTALSEADSFRRRLVVAPARRFHIAFGHSPDFALGKIEADLLLAGHTHGGQIRLPLIGPLVTFSRVPRRWAAGLTRLPGGRLLHVSRGIGLERANAPRLRFLCRPELVVIDLLPGPPGAM